MHALVQMSVQERIPILLHCLLLQSLTCLCLHDACMDGWMDACVHVYLLLFFRGILLQLTLLLEVPLRTHVHTCKYALTCHNIQVHMPSLTWISEKSHLSSLVIFFLSSAVIAYRHASQYLGPSRCDSIGPTSRHAAMKLVLNMSFFV